jgi:two-component system, sensor histidine kinase RpfC
MTSATPGHGFGALLGFFTSRLRGRPDGEHEMVLNRLVISLLILLYLVGTAVFSSYSMEGLYTPLSVATFYFVMSVAFFAHILARPGVSPVRRTLAIVLDMGTLSVGLHIGDEVVAVLYPFYLWIIFGNGFRFGIRYLLVATVAAVVGFSTTIATTDYWGAHSHLSFGLLGALIMLPLYSSTLIRKLSKAKQQAEEASRAKSLFLASVSHELRTPLNAIIGLGDLLRDTSLDAEQRDMTRTIRTSAKSLLGLIDDILDLSRIEAGRIATNVVDFDLHRTVMEIKGMLTAQTRAKGVRLAVHVSPQVPYLLRGEMRHLQEMLTNLVGNAVKFTGQGYIVIAVNLVEQGAAQVRLRFEVSDSGIGIAPEAQSRIFESFTQADETIISRYGGTGLGLAICKQLVEHQGGRIGVDSEVGAGSTFWFELPFTRAAAVAAEPESRRSPVVLLAASEDRTEAVLNALFRVGVGAKIARTVDEVVEMVRAGAAPDTPRPIVIVDEQAVEDVAAAAAKLSALDAACAPSLILLPREPAGGVLAPPLCSRFVAVLSQPFDENYTIAALRIAGIGDAEERDEAPAKPKGPGRKYAILVADDNRTNQKVIAKILERAGHEPTIVDNGERALDALTQHDFDVVLMDVNMPVMNGIEAVKLYRFSALGKKRVPVVALTADATPEMSARCTEAGMDACVTKPVEPARLLQIVEAMVERSAPTAAEPGESETVRMISSHPKFQAAHASVDFAKLADLESLGGSGFVGQLIEEFLVDADAVLREMAAAVAANDVEAFRDRAHALRSGAANIGARNMYKICLSWRNIGQRELASDGEAHVRKLQTEFEEVRAALSRRLEGQPAEPSLKGA